MIQALRTLWRYIVGTRPVDTLATLAAKSDEATLRRLWTSYAHTYGKHSPQAKRLHAALVARRENDRAHGRNTV